MKASALNPGNWLAVLIIAMGRLLAALPTKQGLALGRNLGTALMRCSRSRRSVAETNLAACFPELDAEQRQVLVRANFAATGCGVVEYARAMWGDRERLLADTEVTGLEHLEAAYARGRGVLVIGGHFTCMELAARAVNERADNPVYMLVRRNENRYLESRLDAGRRAHCEKTIEKKALLPLRRALRDNRAVFYAPDQNFTYQSVFAPFFGIPAATVTATGDLAASTGAAVVPIWGWRTADRRYRIEIEPMWENFPTGDREVDAARVNAWIEKRIRAHPEQYLWAHRRFRTRPVGEEPFYPPEARRAKHR